MSYYVAKCLKNVSVIVDMDKDTELHFSLISKMKILFDINL